MSHAAANQIRRVMGNAITDIPSDCSLRNPKINFFPSFVALDSNDGCDL